MSTSTVRTVCGSSARTDLCGGRSAITVPTAIYFFIATVDEIVLEARLCREFLVVNKPVTYTIQSTVVMVAPRYSIKIRITKHFFHYWEMRRDGIRSRSLHSA